MKKTFLLPALLLAGAAHAQTNALKVDIFQPIINTAALSFEHKLSETSSFQLGLSGTFGYKDGAYYSGYSGPSTSGFAITPEYRLYLSEKHAALEGFYVAPFVRYQNLTLKDSYSYTDYDANGSPVSRTSNDEASLDTYGGGIVVGRQWIFKQRFSLDTFLGPSYNSGTVKYKSTSNGSGSLDPGTFTGFGLRAGVTFGLAF